MTAARHLLAIAACLLLGTSLPPPAAAIELPSVLKKAGEELGRAVRSALAPGRELVRSAGQKIGELAGYRTKRQQGDGCRAAVVDLLVSPLVEKDKIRELQISWDVGKRWQQGDYVAVYVHKPGNQSVPVFRSEVTTGSGQMNTGLEEGRKHQDPNYNKRCLGYWVAYWHADTPQIVAESCLGTNPRWMEELKTEIQEMRLDGTFLPGTHDSGSFLLRYAPFFDDRVKKYVYTQDETIMEQLIHGARVFDLRIALYGSHFWVNHGPARVHPLEHVLGDVKNFVENTNEIVVLDFHQFPTGMKKPEHHYKLINFTKSILGEHMAPPHLGWGVKLKTLWEQNKRVIVAYNDKNIVKERYDDIWWPVAQQWGNKRKISELELYFAKVFQSSVDRRGFWSSMVQLTPTAFDLVLDRLKGLRRMAAETNPLVNEWFRGDWGSKANGVCVDFLRSTSIVDSAIRWNRRRARGSMCD